MAGGQGEIAYNWSFGDATISSIRGNTTHLYGDIGPYSVTLTVTDSLGNSAQSSVVVRVYGDRDTDKDKVIDRIDQCPLVYAETPTGCPTIPIYNPNRPVTPRNNAIEAEIGVQSSTGLLIRKTRFPKAEIFSLIPITRSGTWNYRWTAKNIETNRVVTGTGFALPRSVLDL